jgi:hypothetical protein
MLQKIRQEIEVDRAGIGRAKRFFFLLNLLKASRSEARRTIWLMEKHILSFSLHIEGAIKKVLKQVIMPLKFILHQKLLFC